MFQKVTFPATMVVIFNKDLVRVRMVANADEARALLATMIADAVPEERIEECVTALLERGAVYFENGICVASLNIEVRKPFVVDIEEEFEQS